MRLTYTQAVDWSVEAPGGIRQIGWLWGPRGSMRLYFTSALQSRTYPSNAEFIPIYAYESTTGTTALPPRQNPE